MKLFPLVLWVAIARAQDGDSDQDGLSDTEEIALGTGVYDPDTDDDELGDGPEHDEHGTNPLDPDTDAGGVEDGPEVRAGTDPLDAEDDFPDTATTTPPATTADTGLDDPGALSGGGGCRCATRDPAGAVTIPLAAVAALLRRRRRRSEERREHGSASFCSGDLANR